MFDPNVSYRALSWFEEELRKEREGIVEEEEEPEGWWEEANRRAGVSVGEDEDNDGSQEARLPPRRKHLDRRIPECSEKFPAYCAHPSLIKMPQQK